MAHFDKSELENIKPGPIAWMASHPVAANLLMIVMLVGGFLMLYTSKQEVFPEFSMDMATITMSYPGASPAEVEQGIILSIEDAVKDIDGIGEMTSAAYEAYGHVIVEIDDEEETLRILQDIKTAVDSITTFPVDAENLTVTLNKNEEVVITLVLSGSVSENVLRDTADVVRSRLEQHKNISLVELSGTRDHQIHIEISQDNLRKYGLTTQSVANIVAQTSLEVGGGSLKTVAGEVLVRMTERRDFAPEFKDIPIIKNDSGSVVYLGDIATITDTFEDINIHGTFDDKPAVRMDISSTAMQTPVQISNAVKEVMHDLENELPGDLHLAITRDSSEVFQQRANLLVNNGLLGLVLVVIFLTLFLDVRLAFWVSMGIPISYMGAFLLFPGAHYFSINMVSMFAFIIALGIVVDDAIVVGENIYHKREQGLKPLAASVEGARQMAIPVFISVLTNIIAFLPMFFMPGFMGKIFSIIPVVVIATFIVSLFESLFILPAHLTFQQSKNVKNAFLQQIIGFQKGFNKKFNNFIQNRYVPFLHKSLSYRYISLSVFLFILIFTGSYVASGRLGLQMFPRVESDFAYAQAVLKVGSPRKDVKKIEEDLIHAVQEIIVENGGDTLSKGVYSSVNENEITIYAFLTDPEIRPVSTAKITELWRERVGPIPGMEKLSFESNHGGPGSGADLSIEISHDNTDILDEAAVKLSEILSEYPSTQDIDDGTAQGKRQFDFTLTDLGYALGLTPADVGRQVRGSYYGSEALKQQRGRNEVRVLVMLPEEERNSSYHFQNAMIKTPDGADVMLFDVVKADVGRAYTTINRRDSRRVVTIESRINPPSETNLIKNALDTEIMPQLMREYPGLSYSFEGQQADMSESLQSLFIGMFGILFVMYAILAILFSSYSQPFMIMIAIPFSMVGAIAGHYIMDMPMSIVSMFGIIALAGVVINDSLILIDRANQLREEEAHHFNAVIKAASQRFRPIILTTLTTFLGLAPMMLETSLQARFLIPMAISLGFGIVFATFLTLLLIPALYMINEDIQRKIIGTIDFLKGKPRSYHGGVN